MREVIYTYIQKRCLPPAAFHCCDVVRSFWFFSRPVLVFRSTTLRSPSRGARFLFGSTSRMLPPPQEEPTRTRESSSGCTVRGGMEGWVGGGKRNGDSTSASRGVGRCWLGESSLLVVVTDGRICGGNVWLGVPRRVCVRRVGFDGMFPSDWYVSFVRHPIRSPR